MVRCFRIGLVSAFAVLSLSALFANDLANELARGGDVSWDLKFAHYEVWGAISDSGDIQDADAEPISLQFQELGGANDHLDVLIDLTPLGIPLQIPLIANVLAKDLIEWNGSVSPNICITVDIGGQQVNVLITLARGKLTGRLSRISCQADPLAQLSHPVILELNDEGGDAGNFLYMEGYLFCIQSDVFKVYARLSQMDWIGYGGTSLPKDQGNVNGDCCIDDSDIAQLLLDFGSNNSRSDVDGDGVVGDSDLQIVLLNFGRCS